MQLSPAPPVPARPTVSALPARRTPIVGRDAECDALIELLGRDEVRLVTITGPGGVGKTRLAVEVAHGLGTRGLDVAFVSLAGASGPEAVGLEIARGLGLALPAPGPSDADLVALLAGARLLLVLDNFEHVIGAARQVAELLDGAPGLRLLATSRAPLRIGGEHEFPLAPLPIDDDAMELFAQRAAAVQPGFTVGPDNAAVVEEICRRLDGLPLAIELAAARLRALSAEALLARLDRRMSLLSAGPRDAPERQQTLHNAIAWSYDLLPAAERRLFRCLAIFAGGFTLDAAEAVIGDRSWSLAPVLSRASPVTLAHQRRPEEEDASLAVMDGVFALVDQSLLRRVESPGNEARFVMLETIRDFARDELAVSQDWQPLRRAFAAYYGGKMSRAAAGAKGPDGVRWTRWVDEEIDHLRAAVQIMIEDGDKAGAIGMLTDFSSWWSGRFSLREIHGWVERATALPGDLTPAQQFDAEFTSAWVANFMGRAEEADAHARRASVIGPTTGRPKDPIRAHNLLGGLAFQASDWHGAARAFSEGIARAAALDGDKALQGMLHNLGLARIAVGDFDGAREALESGLSEARSRGDRMGEALCMVRLAMVAYFEDDVREAARLSRAALARVREARNQLGTIEVLGVEAVIAERLGDLDRARRYAEIAEHASADVGAVDRAVPNAFLDIFDTVRDRLGVPKRAIGMVEQASPLPDELIDELLALPLPEGRPDISAGERAGEELGLTPREVEIVRLLAKGRSNQEIADELFISLRTVQTHVSNILGKLKLGSRAAVAAVAVRHGID